MNNYRHVNPDVVIGPEHRAARDVDCPACVAVAGQWCPRDGTTWYLHPERLAAVADSSVASTASTVSD